MRGDELDAAILRFFEREGADDQSSVEAGHPTLISDHQGQKIALAIVRSHEYGTIGGDDMDAAESLFKEFNQYYVGYALANLVIRGEVLPMRERPDDEWTFVIMPEGLREEV